VLVNTRGTLQIPLALHMLLLEDLPLVVAAAACSQQQQPVAGQVQLGMLTQKQLRAIS
jgi:hypothetical protein